MNGTRRTLLIVEDDPSLQKQMQWAFDSYETVVASDRESAIAQLRRYEPRRGDDGPRVAATAG